MSGKTFTVIAMIAIGFGIVAWTACYVADMLEFERQRTYTLHLQVEPDLFPPKDCFAEMTYFDQSPTVLMAYTYVNGSDSRSSPVIMIFWSGDPSGIEYVELSGAEASDLIEFAASDNVELSKEGLSRQVIISPEALDQLAVVSVRHVRFLNKRKTPLTKHFSVGQMRKKRGPDGEIIGFDLGNRLGE